MESAREDIKFKLDKNIFFSLTFLYGYISIHKIDGKT